MSRAVRPAPEHPDLARQHRREVTRLAAEDRRRQCREEEDERRILVGPSTAADDGHDFHDPAERDYLRMEAEDHGPHPNDWGG